MPPGEFEILVINPGSTSTKIAYFREPACECSAAEIQPPFVRNIRHSDATLRPFRGRPVVSQLNFRQESIRVELAEAAIQTAQFDAVVARGGLLRPLASGVYRVNDEMLDELRRASVGEHASNLGPLLALGVARQSGCPAFVVDPVSVDELAPVARISGSALLTRPSLSHALNTKAVARRYARERGVSYEDLRLVIAHLGSGISISAHENGRMIDINLAGQEGAMSTERSGGLPLWGVMDLCFSGRYSRQELMTAFTREGGLYSYLGTNDLAEVERRIADGHSFTALIFQALVYQVAKDIGALATVLHGDVDAIILTGGMARSERLVDYLRVAVEWIAAVVVYPGEDELQALAQGALRVLRGQEYALELQPDGPPRAQPQPAYTMLPGRTNT
jgi:butyrate kinase